MSAMTAAEMSGCVSCRGGRRNNTSPTCLTFAKIDTQENADPSTAAPSTPNTACVKNASPAYRIATNQRLLLSEDNARMRNADSVI